MVRLLSTCVVLVFVATLILDCEALRMRSRNVFCCFHRICLMGGRVGCCDFLSVCVGKRGNKTGVCRRVQCAKRNRYMVEPEEEEAEALDTLTADR